MFPGVFRISCQQLAGVIKSTEVTKASFVLISLTVEYEVTATLTGINQSSVIVQSQQPLRERIEANEWRHQ